VLRGYAANLSRNCWYLNVPLLSLQHQRFLTRRLMKHHVDACQKQEKKDVSRITATIAAASPSTAVARELEGADTERQWEEVIEQTIEKLCRLHKSAAMCPSRQHHSYDEAFHRSRISTHVRLWVSTARRTGCTGTTAQQGQRHAPGGCPGPFHPSSFFDHTQFAHWERYKRSENGLSPHADKISTRLLYASAKTFAGFMTGETAHGRVVGCLSSCRDNSSSATRELICSAGQFDCSKCCLFNKLQHKSELTGEEGEEMRKCIRHRDTRLFQQQHYQQVRAGLQSRQLLVLMDFTSAHLTPKIDHAVNSSVVQDCIVVLEYISNGERMRENIDFLCDCPDTNKKDYHFVLHVWLLLFHFKKLIDHFDCMDVWSDGGPHHFKTRYCQWMWHWLSQTHFAKRRISHHFFASYHGHSLADAHAASIKRLIRTEYNMSQRGHRTKALLFCAALIDHTPP
jgi:hypothetical protein